MTDNEEQNQQMIAKGVCPSKAYVLRELSFPFAERLSDCQTTLAVLATGAIEQHGPHLPLGTDSLIAEQIISALISEWNKLAEQASRTDTDPLPGPIVVFPQLDIGCSTEHETFPGTVTLSEAAIRTYLRDVCRSLSRLGLKRLLLVNFHGGNTSLLRGLLRSLRKETGVICMLYDVYSSREMAPYSMNYDYHAGAAETSIMQALYPLLVSAYPDETTGASTPHELLKLDQLVSFPWFTTDISQNGVIGKPEEADSAQGEMLVQNITEAIIHAIIEIQHYVKTDTP